MLKFLPFSLFTKPSAVARQLAALLAAAGVLLVVACQKQDAETLANDFSALPLMAPAPADNPSSPAKVALGRALFWDPILSGGRDVSCASCHHPATGYADGIDLAIGENGVGTGPARHFSAGNDLPLGQRNTPTILNAGFNNLAADGSCDPTHAAMFWDSRAQSLETQALLPLTTLEEMRGHQFSAATACDSVVARLRGVAEYQQLFRTAFGGTEPITAANLSRAIACFERTLLATDAPFDRYLRGDNSALSTEQVQGLNAFVQSGCNKCHSGPMLSDYKTHVTGFPDNSKHSTDTGQNGTYAFRTPSLRNVALTAPYSHGGAVPTLAAVLNVYDPGPGGQRSTMRTSAASSSTRFFQVA